MKHQYSTLVRSYDRYKKMLIHLISLRLDAHLLGVLIKHITCTTRKLYSLKIHLGKGSIATSVFAVTMAFMPVAQAQLAFKQFDPPFFPQPLDAGIASSPVFFDLDGDGDLDLLSGESLGTFRFYENDGTGTLTEIIGIGHPFGFIVPEGISTPAVVDIDNDGDMDVVSGSEDGTFYLFQNDGLGNFTEIVVDHPFEDIDVGIYSTPTFFDVDSDGDMDLISGEYYGSFLFFQNDGTGSFTEITGAANPFDGFDVGDLSAPIFADVDNDGDMDLVSGERDGSFRLYKNDGTGLFNEISGMDNPFNEFSVGLLSRPTFADINGDEVIDLVSGDQVGTFTVYQNNDMGIYTELMGTDNSFNGINVFLFSTPTFVDVDGDGDMDLVCGERSGKFNFFQNDGDGMYTEITGALNPFTGLAVEEDSNPSFVDVDDDGDMDLVSGDHNGTFKLFQNDGAGNYIEITAADNPFDGFDVGFISSPAFADVDGDGDMDLVSGADEGIFLFFENDGNGNYTEIIGPANPFNEFDIGNSSRPTFVDFDEDGDIDLVSSKSIGQFIFYKNDGTGDFSASVVEVSPLEGYFDYTGRIAPTFTDLDGDGDMDLVSGGFEGKIIAHENLGILATTSFTIQDVSLYPNPTGSILQIDTPAGLNAISIIDITGRHISTLNLNGETQTSVDMQNLSPAVYFVKIKTALGEVTKRVIKR